MVTTKTATKCECERALSRAVAKRERAHARQEAWLASLDPELRAYWEGSITASLLASRVRVVVAGGCSCGRAEAVAA